MLKLLCLDVEVLPNYFLINIQRLDDGKRISFEAYESFLPITDRKKLTSILLKHTSFGFNSNNYDMPIINAILDGKNCKEIHGISKEIVENGIPAYASYRQFDIEQRPFKHFDIKEPSPAVMISLKNYGTRVGSKKLQEFYLDPHTPITKEQVDALKDYCWNDIDVTIDLYNSIKGRMELRESMSEQYALDLMSKSDAQIAETVITSELSKQKIFASKPTLPQNYKAKYTAPDYINFESEELQDLVRHVQAIEFELAANGAVKMPSSLANKKINIGQTVYKMGIGGLHSQEKKLSVVSNDYSVMRNADFTSYYPFIILNNKLYPKHLGEGFLDVYRNIVETRVVAKQRQSEIKAELKELEMKGLY